MPLLQRLIATHAPASTILIRVLVGAVFLSEGIQKFLFADKLGAGRFAKIGIPIPDILGPTVGVFETVCGTLVLIGLGTRLAAIPLLVIISTALATTKWPILQQQGFWSAAHEARTDISMLLGLIFLLIQGGGSLSCDWRISGDRGR
jgi:uncharacterized membrane protein YphA (DoxX/SURF4 family)